MKFPYGIADFYKLRIEGHYYCDRTGFIPILEDFGSYLLFIRPRRFGKSLLLSTIQQYYDVAKKDEFDRLYGNLAIGKNPTSLRNQYFVLKLDFSCVNPIGSVKDIQKSLYDHINMQIQGFSMYYRKFLPKEITIYPDNAISSLSMLLSVAKQTSHRVYLLIDEYDNFANEIMVDVHEGRKTYEALLYDKGPLKTLFKAIKSFSNTDGIDRTFITGVSPVVMSDLTSGYNIAENIYLEPEFNTLCGFTESEIEDALAQISEICGFSEQESSSVLNQMRIWYNGYIFSESSQEKIYNPTLALYFLKRLDKSCTQPDRMLDANLSADQGKLQYLSQLPRGDQMILDISNQGYTRVESQIADRFGMADMLSDFTKDNQFIASYLYYFGVLTMGGRNEKGELQLSIPNLVMRGLYVERIRRMLLPDPGLRDDGIQAAKSLYQDGNIDSACQFVEEHYFAILNNRDYRWANELTVKMTFLTLLYNDRIYIMDSETSVHRGYADLTMIIRPDMRQYKIFDVLVEFKYVSLKTAGLSTQQAKALTRMELENLPEMKTAMEEAQKQAKSYGDILVKKHGSLRLRRFAVVSLGFERIWGVEVVSECNECHN